MTASPRSLPLVALALGVAILVVQIRVIAGGQTWDDVRYHTEVAPPRLAAAGSVQRGDVPAWWDGSGLGVTLAGEPGHGALYPPTWLAATPRALDLLIVAHLAWLALGVCVWARRTASDRSALVAGVLVATTGIAMSAALRGALPALAHVPWLGATVGWLGQAASRRERSRAALALGGLLGMIALAGQLAVLVDAIAIALVLGLGRGTWRWLAAAIAAGLAIGAVQWLPAVIQLSGEAAGEVSGLPLARLVELLVPGAFGASASTTAVPAIAGASPWAPSLFVGAPLLALASVRAPSGRLLVVIGALVAAALLVARGGWPAWLGAPEQHIAVLTVVLAACAAGGLDTLVLGQRRAVLALALGAGFAALALGAVAVLRVQHRELAPAIDRALIDGALGVVCTAAGAVLAWRAPGRAMAVLFALVVAPSVGAAHSLAQTVDRAQVSEPPAWAQLAAHVARPARSYRPEPMYTDERPTVEDAIATFAGESAWRWGIAAARSDDPARPEIHDATWLAAAHGSYVLLDRFGISLAIVPSTLVAARGLRLLGQRGSWALVELPVAPPASVMRGWRWAVAPGDALALLFPSTGEPGLPRGTIVLAGAGPAGPTSPQPLACPIQRWRDGEIELSCTTEDAGYAVVSSGPAAGWQVAIDDQEAAWLTADVLRRAVAIPAGAHRIRWTYALPGLPAGAGIALAGCLALVGLWIAGWDRYRHAQIIVN